MEKLKSLFTGLKATHPLVHHWAATLALKAKSKSSSGGKAVKSRTVLEKKDIFLWSVLQLMVWNVLMSLVLLNHLSFLMETVSIYSIEHTEASTLPSAQQCSP